MTNNIDPWELLSEARESIEQDFDWGEHDAAGRQTLLSLLKRIDAALAEHDAVLVFEKTVEWRITEHRPTVFHILFNGADIEVSLGAERWRWEVTREGDSATLDEAKSAAIAAAKSMK